MKELTIITPCSRPNNLPLLYESIEFSLIKKWLIVYDSDEEKIQPKFNHTKISEWNENRTGFSGNTQRNRGIEETDNGLIYFLDDDNIMHPNFWNILPEFSENKINLFEIDGHPCKQKLNLQHPGPGTFDTSMFCIDRKLIGEKRWLPHLYSADGVFVASINTNLNSLKIFDQTASYYNYLSKNKNFENGKSTSASAKKTAEIIIANENLYSLETVKSAKFGLLLKEIEVSDKSFSYIQIKYLAKCSNIFSHGKKKNLFIRGTGQSGRKNLQICLDLGLEVKGFIAPIGSEEVGTKIDEVLVYSSVDVIKETDSFILISSTFFIFIENEMKKLGLREDIDFMTLI